MQQGLNQSCSPCRYLSNAVLHSQFGRREKVDSQRLVVRSQIVSLTPGLSSAHNLGCRCPNGQCEAIFDIYVSRPFQRHQEYFNARCFGPCCRALNIQESQRTPNLQLFQVLGFTPTLGPKWGCDKCHFVLRLPSGNPEIPKIGTPKTLEAHNFVCKPSIEVKSKEKL